MAAPQEDQQVMLEDVRIIFRNFSGIAGRFNEPGDRNFSVCLPDDIAERMKKDGWNVKWLEPRMEEDLRQAILKVNVKYRNKDGVATRPPRVVLITSRGKTILTEDMLTPLDWAEITKVDMIIRPYHYEAAGKTGISAYLKSIYVTIQEDPLEMKYLDVPDSAQTALVGEEDEEKDTPF